jgi:hypothetical protein
MTANKNLPKSQRDPVPFTGYELKTMSGAKLKRLMYGASGRVARPGIIAIINRKIAEYDKS